VEFRGVVMRLVMRENNGTNGPDDLASGYGLNQDPHQQTPGIEALGNVVRVTYVDSGGVTRTAQLDVGRPKTENNNGPNHTFHDIREVKVRAHVFRNQADTAPSATQAQVETDLRLANERLAQSTIRIVTTMIDMGGAGSPGIPRPTAFYDGIYNASQVFPIAYHTTDERALMTMLDGNAANTIDIFYVGCEIGPGYPADTYALAYGAFTNAEAAAPDAKKFIAVIKHIGQRPDAPYVIAHEMMHLLLNRGHRDMEPENSVFHGVQTNGDHVQDGRKRIGLYLGETSSGPVNTSVCDGDTGTIRNWAETLP
jgi:hypothetical protein